ncbi:MAG: PilZ domain-containing protein [bacterium]|nr:PilZ domain-containing protein [bacterium]
MGTRVLPPAPDQERRRVTIAVDAPNRAFAPGVQAALKRLGYNLVSEREPSGQEEAQDLPAPQLLIIDERRIADMSHPSTRLPVILLTGAQGDAALRGSKLDDLAIGIVRRRARLVPLYELLQTTFESQPRSVPRVEDALPARATRDGVSWPGAIRSISEKGCLLQSSEVLEDDQPVELCFPLANQGLVHILAMASYQAGDRTGLVFDETISEETRRALSEYVTDRLAN